jgi:methionyl-tRNA synthetase
MSQLYTADLANELGNLVSRTCAIAAKDGIEVDSAGTSIDFYSPQCDKNELNELELLLQYQDPLVSLWREFKTTNKSFNEFEPWSKSHQERDSFLKKTLVLLNSSSLTLKAYLPEIGAKIQKATSGKIEKITPLFPRLIT